ncbi:MAG: hypothetical protein LBS86_02950 [Treponema sp.]|nr:hypothetical protein [Treponema sp.]
MSISSATALRTNRRYKGWSLRQAVAEPVVGELVEPSKQPPRRNTRALSPGKRRKQRA